MTGAVDPVRAIADAYVASLAADDADAAAAIGADGPALTDTTPEAMLRRDALAADTIARLDAAEGGDPVLRAALRERLASERVLLATGFTARLVAPLATPVHLVRGTFDGLEVTPDAAGDRLVRRLDAAAGAIRGYERRLRWAAEHPERFSGTAVAPRRQLDALAAQIDGWLAGDSFAAVPIAASVGTETRARVARGRERANAALAALRDALRGDLREHAPSVDAIGEDEYARIAATMLGARVDVADTYAFGWAELERLSAEARRLAARLGDTGADPVRAAAERLDRDPARRIRGVPHIRRWLADRVAASIDGVADAFELPDGVGDVVCVVSEAASGVVFYTPGAPDGSAPPRVLWTLPDGEADVATWHEVTSVHHEGVPGHHLQFAITSAHEGLHPWQRHLCHVHGYAEGWAHYAEHLADELGLIRDDAERLGLVLGRLWRAVRIVADIGLHTGRPIPDGVVLAPGEWTVDRARDALVELAHVDPVLAGFEVDRYLAWPGQALAFGVGARLWRQARRRREEQDGAAFSLRTFHRDALALGPMGLDPLAALVTRGRR